MTEPEYCNDIRRRMAHALAGPEERKRTIAKTRNAMRPDDHGPLFGGSDSAKGGATDLRSLRGRKIGPVGLKW